MRAPIEAGPRERRYRAMVALLALVGIVLGFMGDHEGIHRAVQAMLAFAVLAEIAGLREQIAGSW